MENTEASKLQRLAVLRSLGSLTLAVKALAIVGAIMAIYYGDLRLIFTDALQNEATNYVLVIPFIFAYFLFRKRKMLRTVASVEASGQSGGMKYFSEVVGLLLCAVAVILYWYGSYSFTPLEYHVLTLPLFTAGLVLVLFNVQTLREMVFPIIFLVLLTPPPSTVLYGIGSTLSVIASEVSSTLVAWFGVRSRISGEYGNPTITITRPDTTTVPFTLDIACSGVYPLMGFVVFAFLMAYTVRGRAWKRASMFLLGLPLIYLLNIVRITGILLIGYQFGEQLALDIFHLLGGLVLMGLGVALLLVLSEKLFKMQMFTKTASPQPCPGCNPVEDAKTSFCESCGRLLKYPAVKLGIKDLAKIAAVGAAVALLVSIQVPVFALAQGPAQFMIKTASGEVGNAQILPQIPNYNLSFVYRDKNFEQKAKQDASLIYCYTPLDASSNYVWVGVEVAPTRSSLHTWEGCLITWPQTIGRQPSVTQLDLRDVQIRDNPPVIGRYFAFQYAEYNETQVVLYWYETSTFMTNNTAEQKEVEISLISYLGTPEDIAEAENAMLPLAKAVTGYWQPTRMWAPLALALAQNGLDLAPLVLSVLAGTVIFHMIERGRYRRAKTKAYHKVSEEDQEILDAACQTKQSLPSTRLNIAIAYQNTSHRTLTREVLVEKLRHAEESGLASSRIVNHSDEPLMTWKANFDKPATGKSGPIDILRRRLKSFF